MNEQVEKIYDGVEKGENLLEMQTITKIYGNGFAANKNVNFTVKKGEIHGLVGENGAGKTTLMKVLFGLEIPEEGSIYLGGKKLSIANPLNALDYGIGMVHQHFMLIESLTVAENMVLGKEPVKGLRFDYKKALQNSLNISQKYDLGIDPNARVRDLSVGFKQRVEILKMLLHGTKILLLDEPTAVLTPQETKELFNQLKLLKEKGLSIVFISHKLNEIKEICDRITVLRKGKSIISTEIDEISEKEISALMVGREVNIDLDKPELAIGEVVLKVRDLSFLNKYDKFAFNNLNFDLHEGEILGVAAVEGNGQSELASILSGLEKVQKGTVSICGTSIKNKSIKEIRDLGVSIVHEDRMMYGASVNQAVFENLISDRYTNKENLRYYLLNYKKILNDTKNLIKEFSVKCDGVKEEVKTLSGGNIQKLVAAREFTSSPNLLLLSQPTRGIDIGAAELIRKNIIKLREEKAAILLFSADLTELLTCSDKIIVMYEGQIVAFFSNVVEVNEEILGEYMLGLKKMSYDEMVGLYER